MPKKQTEDNSSAFKNWISSELLRRMGRSLKSVHPAFDSKALEKISPKLQSLELKGRVRLIRDELHKLLPHSYPDALKILRRSAKEGSLNGFDLWAYTEFIQNHGLAHQKLSLEALSEITTRFTAEFAVRPFIKQSPKETLAFLNRMTTSRDVHLRRWASEGSRPRLPWGERLDVLIKEPRLTMTILEALKWDDELYVRKSVANHLNDISKDHPALVIQILKSWIERSRTSEQKTKIDWIVRHALRTLIKSGHPKALGLIGAHARPKVKVSELKINRALFHLEDRIEFEIQIESAARGPQKIVADYLIHYQKANGSTQPKVFKMKTFELGPGEKHVLKKTHHLKKVTTRRHYPGLHYLEIQINGRPHAKVKWLLK